MQVLHNNLNSLTPSLLIFSGGKADSTFYLKIVITLTFCSCTYSTLCDQLGLAIIIHDILSLLKMAIETLYLLRKVRSCIELIWANILHIFMPITHSCLWYVYVCQLSLHMKLFQRAWIGEAEGNTDPVRYSVFYVSGVLIPGRIVLISWRWFDGFRLLSDG